MTEQGLATRPETAIAQYDFSGLYTNVERYETRFSPWKAILLQKNHDFVNEDEIGGVAPRPGMWLVGPLDGTGRDQLFPDGIHVLLMEYFSGRIFNAVDENGNPTDGVNSPRLCGSMDGKVPYFPLSVREACEEAGEPVHVKLTDWRRPDMGEIIIDETSSCVGCPLADTRVFGEGKKWLPPPCKPFPRLFLYCFEVGRPIQIQTKSVNVVRILEGRSRPKKNEDPIPGIRKMCWPENLDDPNALPPFFINGLPHAVRLGSKNFETAHQVIKVPTLAYAEEPLTPEQWDAYKEAQLLYNQRKESILAAMRQEMEQNEIESYDAADEQPFEDAAPKKEPDPVIRSNLGSGKGKRRLADDDDSL
jgi:hypothetical protein